MTDTSELQQNDKDLINLGYIKAFFKYWDSNIKALEWGANIFDTYKNYTSEFENYEEFTTYIELSTFIIGWKPAVKENSENHEIELQIHIRKKNHRGYEWYDQWSTYESFKTWFDKDNCPYRDCECGDLLTSENSAIGAVRCQDCSLFKKTLKEGDKCCICLENDLQVWNILSCGHCIHKKCCSQIKKDKYGHFKCPLCRKEQYSSYDLEILKY
jgi:hypothetical protein